MSVINSSINRKQGKIRQPFLIEYMSGFLIKEINFRLLMLT